LIVGCRAGEVCDSNPAPYVVDRTWMFETVYRDKTNLTPGGPVRDGVAEDAIVFGRLAFSPLGAVSPSGRSLVATGHLFSDETGDQYWVQAEAPAGTGGPGDPVGGTTNLYQDQYFVKKSSTAWMQVSITHMDLEAIDTHRLLDTPDDCPEVPGVAN